MKCKCVTYKVDDKDTSFTIKLTMIVLVDWGSTYEQDSNKPFGQIN